ncbi:MAG: F0F1-type synthase subunit b, F-type H+-transporting ATPase subunit b [Candidatus Parcubacteria bacterium]
MDEIIHTFGIDWRLIAIQLFNFALLLGALSYFLYTPVLKMLDERKRIVAKGVLDAKDAALARENAEQEKGAIIKKAVTEAGDIVKRGEEAAEREAQGIVLEAEAQSARIVKDGEAKAAALADSIRKSTEADIAKVAILAAEKVLKERA